MERQARLTLVTWIRKRHLTHALQHMCDLIDDLLPPIVARALHRGEAPTFEEVWADFMTHLPPGLSQAYDDDRTVREASREYAERLYELL